MNLLRHGVASLVIFSLMAVLFTNGYNGLDTAYNFTDEVELTLNETNDYNLTTGNIMEQFNQMTLMEGVNELQAGILDLTAGDSAFDVLGGLTASGIGSVKIIVGLVSAPFTILNIITSYYGGDFIPAGIIDILGTILAVYAFFILLSAYLRSDI